VRLHKDEFYVDGPILRTRKGRKAEDEHYRSYGLPFSYSVLEQFLLSKCGQSWDEVHSILAERFPKRRYKNVSLWQAIMSLVDTHTWMHDGKVIGQQRYYRSRGSLFVHPETGSLLVELQVRTWWLGRRVATAPSTIIKIDEAHAYVNIRGIWYHCTYERRVVEWYVGGSQFQEEHGRSPVLWKLVGKKQLNTKELLKLGVKNT
jgi:hypothetical protein